MTIKIRIELELDFETDSAKDLDEAATHAQNVLNAVDLGQYSITNVHVKEMYSLPLEPEGSSHDLEILENRKIIKRCVEILKKHPNFSFVENQGFLVVGDGDLKPFYLPHGNGRVGGLAGHNGALLIWWGIPYRGTYTLWYGPSQAGHLADWGHLVWPTRKGDSYRPFGNTGGRKHVDLLEAIEVLIPGFKEEFYG